MARSEDFMNPEFVAGPVKRKGVDYGQLSQASTEHAQGQMDRSAALAAQIDARNAPVADDDEEGDFDLAVDPTTGDIATSLGRIKGTPKNIMAVSEMIRAKKLAPLGKIPPGWGGATFDEYEENLAGLDREGTTWRNVGAGLLDTAGSISKSADLMVGTDAPDSMFSDAADSLREGQTLKQRLASRDDFWENPEALGANLGTFGGNVLGTLAGVGAGAAAGTALGGPAGTAAGAYTGGAIAGGGATAGDAGETAYNATYDALKSMPIDDLLAMDEYKQIRTDNPKDSHEKALERMATEAAQAAMLPGAVLGAGEAVIGAKIGAPLLKKLGVAKLLGLEGAAAGREAIEGVVTPLRTRAAQAVGRGIVAGTGESIIETAQTVAPAVAAARQSGVGSRDPMDYLSWEETQAVLPGAFLMGMGGAGGGRGRSVAELDPAEVVRQGALGVALESSSDVDRGIAQEPDSAVDGIPAKSPLATRQEEIATQAADIEAREAPFREGVVPEGPLPPLPPGAVPQGPVPEQVPGIASEPRGELPPPNLAERRAFQQMQGEEAPIATAPGGEQAALPPPAGSGLQAQIEALSQQRDELDATIMQTREALNNMPPRDPRRRVQNQKLAAYRQALTDLDLQLDELDEQWVTEREEAGPGGVRPGFEVESPAPEPPPGAPQDLAPDGTRPMGVAPEPLPNEAPMSTEEATSRAQTQQKRRGPAAPPVAPQAPSVPPAPAPAAVPPKRGRMKETPEAMQMEMDWTPGVPADEGPPTAGTPEPQADVKAQIAALGDPASGRVAVLVQPGNKIPPRLPKNVKRYVGTAGTLLTADAALGEKYRSGKMTDKQVGKALGAVVGREQAAKTPGVTAIEAVTPAGAVQASQVTTPGAKGKAAIAVSKQAQPGATIREVTPQAGQEQRAKGRKAEKAKRKPTKKAKKQPPKAAAAIKKSKQKRGKTDEEIEAEDRADIEAAGAAEFAPEDVQEETAAPAPEPVKRGRGRPRKAAAAIETSTAADKIAKAETDTSKALGRLRALGYTTDQIKKMGEREMLTLIRENVHATLIGRRMAEAKEAMGRKPAPAETPTEEPKGKKKTAQPRATSRAEERMKEIEARMTARAAAGRKLTEFEKEELRGKAERVANWLARREIKAIDTVADPAPSASTEKLIAMSTDVPGAAVKGAKGKAVDTRVVEIDPEYVARLKRRIKAAPYSKRAKDAQKELNQINQFLAAVRAAEEAAVERLKASLSEKDTARLEHQTNVEMEKHEQQQHGQPGRPREKPAKSPILFLPLTVAETRGYLRAAREEAQAELGKFNPETSVYRRMLAALVPSSFDEMATKEGRQKWLAYLADKSDLELEVILAVSHTQLTNSAFAKQVMRGSNEVTHAINHVAADPTEVEEMMTEAEVTPQVIIHETVPREAAKLLSGWVTHFERGGNKFNAPIRLVSMRDAATLFPRADFANNQAVYRPLLDPKTGKIRAHIIAIEPGAHSDSPLAFAETMAHEYGKLVLDAMYVHTDDRTKRLLSKAYIAFLNRQPGHFASEIATSRETPYGREFHEWGARNVAMYLMDPTRPVHTVTEKFWKRVADALKKVWADMTGRTKPDEAWAEALDRWIEGSRVIEPSMPATQVAFPGAPAAVQDLEEIATEPPPVEAPQPEPVKAPEPEPVKEPEPVEEVGDPRERTDAEVEEAVDGKDAVQLANWLALNHPDADKRAIAKATGKKIAELQAAGLKVTVHYPKIGDMAPSGLDGAHGLVQPRFRKEGTTFDVWFNPAKAGRRSGMRVSTLLHELVHVATHASVQLGNRTKAADSANKRAIIRLIEVKAALNEHFKERKAFISRTSGMFTDVERHLFEGSNGSLNSLDELLAEANSDRAFQDYLRSIPYKKTTLWGELVSAVREFLGVAAGSESALDEVMSITEELYAAPISELKAAAEAMGADFLPGSDLFKLVDDGPRPLTFDEMPFNADTGPQKLGKRVVKAATEGISGIRGLFEPAKEGKLASAAKGLGYGLMDMRSMVRMLEAANSTAKDSVKGWMRHMNKKSQLAKQVQETAARWVREAGQLTKKHQFYLEKVMAEATTYKIHPDAEWEVVQPPGADKDKSKRIPDPNAHLRDEDPKVYAENKKRYDALRHTWNELVGSEPRVEKIYKGMRDEIQDLHRRSFELRKKFVEDNKMLSEANKKKIIALYHDLYNRNQSGPYFPKKRFGDWYVTVKLPEQRIGTDGKVNGDFFATEESAKEEQKRQKALHPDAKPYVKKTEDGYAVMLNVRAVAFYESQAEARSPEARAELIAEVKERYADVEGGMDAAQLEMGEEKIISEPNMKRADFGDTKAMGAAFGEELAKLMTDPSFPPELAEELRYLQYQSMPENSYTKQLLPRKDIIGASKNMLQAYVVGMQGAANNYARLKHGKDIDQNWEEAWAAARKAGDASAERVLTELGKNQALVAKRERESVGENALSTISQINSLYSLGFSVPYALSNMTQPWMVTVPVLGAFANGRTGKVVGNVKAAKYMKAAYEDAFGFFTKRAVQETVTEWRGLVNKGGGDFTQSDFQKQMIERFAKNDPQFAEVMQHLYDSGLLDYTFISAMSDAAKSSGQGLAKVQRLSMAFPAQIEAMNRLVTAKAAVNLARDEFLVSEPDSVNELSLFAEDIVAQTQGDYSRSNRARVFNTAVGGIAFQFKQYLQMMYMLFGHNLVQALRPGASPAQRKQSLRTIRNLMMSHAAIAGASGLGPVSMAAKVILGMAAMALGDEDDEWKSGEQLQSEVLTGLFGKEMAEVADQGLPRLIGADLGDRQSFPDLFDTRFLGVQQGAKPGEWMDAFLAQSAGAAYANTKRVGNGLRALAQGRGWDASQALPSGLRPVVQSIRMAQQGMVDGDGDVVIPASELGWKDMAIKSIGAQPAAIARRYEEQREIKGTHARIVAKRRQVMQDARNGEISWDDVREFNKTVRPGFRISPAQLQQAKASKGKREAGVEPKGEAEVRRMLGR